MPRYPALPKQADLPAFERETLERWKAEKVFEKSLESTAGKPRWVFYEGPPTANGKPGVHHVEARAFKDLFPRYKTMKGFHVPRRAGWDCHGLPVELQVEKELGFTAKSDIEAYGVAAFNARCRESALSNVAEFAAMTERMGYWVDLDAAYLTMSPSYVESVWWSLKQLFDKGLLVEDYRVTPYCPRDETPLSDHEVSDGYVDTVDPSVYVRFPIQDGPLEGADLLVWTTTPWTLPANTAVAVNPGLDYVLTTDGLVVAAARAGEMRIARSFKGTDLLGTPYRRPLDLLPGEDFGDRAHRVVAGDFVTGDSGTGLVHLAPAFGADDLAAASANGLSLVNPIGPDGRFHITVPLVGGMFFKDADAPLVEELRSRGVLFKQEPYRHPYPTCWRCHTKLIYYALPSWYVRTTAVKDRLLAENANTDWHPARVRDGRYGAWLDDNVDWALSRNRYWGTPLPVWRCTADRTHLRCVGSLAELSELTGTDLSALDPHRPYVDDVVVPCATCAADSRRVAEVIDVWYDSGAMPFAQWGAPHRDNDEFEANFPAQFICEAIDQTRGWFYSLMAEGTLLFDRSPYEAVVCLGLILDGEGRKMSKHVGNILDPFEAFERFGADAVRWLMLASGSPWNDRRVGPEALAEVVRKVLLTVWNTVSFYVLYANAAGTGKGEKSDLDRWMSARLHAVNRDVGAALDGFDPATAGRHLAELVDDLSNWYVRRSRRRFWHGDPAALDTLRECLDVLLRMMAPFTPFLTDYLWRHLNNPESVHLASWPEPDPATKDDELLARMAVVRQVVELGRATRAAGKVRTRQPLARALVAAPGFAGLPEGLRAEIADELNVLTVEPMSGELTERSVKPNFRGLGKRFGSRTQEVAALIRRAGASTVVLDGETVELGPEEVIVTETPREGWVVTSEGGLTVALDLTLTDELRRAGLVRDVLRLVQDKRRQAGLEITDRIVLTWSSSDPEVRRVMEQEKEWIAGEVLATRIVEGGGDIDFEVRKS